VEADRISLLYLMENIEKISIFVLVKSPLKNYLNFVNEKNEFDELHVFFIEIYVNQYHE